MVSEPVSNSIFFETLLNSIVIVFRAFSGFLPSEDWNKNCALRSTFCVDFKIIYDFDSLKLYVTLFGYAWKVCASPLNVCIRPFFNVSQLADVYSEAWRFSLFIPWYTYFWLLLWFTPKLYLLFVCHWLFFLSSCIVRCKWLKISVWVIWVIHLPYFLSQDRKKFLARGNNHCYTYEKNLSDRPVALSLVINEVVLFLVQRMWALNLL